MTIVGTSNWDSIPSAGPATQSIGRRVATENQSETRCKKTVENTSSPYNGYYGERRRGVAEWLCSVAPDVRLILQMRIGTVRGTHGDVEFNPTKELEGP